MQGKGVTMFYDDMDTDNTDGGMVNMPTDEQDEEKETEEEAI